MKSFALATLGGVVFLIALSLPNRAMKITGQLIAIVIEVIAFLMKNEVNK